MADQDDDDDIPTLHDVVRPGNGRPRGGGNPGPGASAPPLTEAEIEALAHRVLERHSAEIEQALARAIRSALAGHASENDDEPDLDA